MMSRPFVDKGRTEAARLELADVDGAAEAKELKSSPDTNKLQNILRYENCRSLTYSREATVASPKCRSYFIHVSLLSKRLY